MTKNDKNDGAEQMRAMIDDAMAGDKADAFRARAEKASREQTIAAMAAGIDDATRALLDSIHPRVAVHVRKFAAEAREMIEHAGAPAGIVSGLHHFILRAALDMLRAMIRDGEEEGE